jgi:hypothetical protein
VSIEGGYEGGMEQIRSSVTGVYGRMVGFSSFGPWNFVKSAAKAGLSALNKCMSGRTGLTRDVEAGNALWVREFEAESLHIVIDVLNISQF